MNRAENDTILEVKDLRTYFPVYDGIIRKKKIGEIKALDGIGFSLKKGEILGIVGESGCGKSTLLKSIAQLCKTTSGTILFHNKDLSRLDRKSLLKERRHIQMIFQSPYSSLDPKMKVEAIISEPLRIYNRRGLLDHKMTKDEIKKQVDILLDKVALPRSYKTRYPKELSGGEAQRVAIARAIALKPDVILADEAVSSLDVSTESQILALIKSLKEEMGIAFIFISHDLNSIEKIATRVLVMYKGKIVELCNGNNLEEMARHPYTKALLSALYTADPKIEKEKKRIVLDGEVTPEETYGCPFYPRCNERLEYCAGHEPELKETGTEHYAACFKVQSSFTAGQNGISS